MSMDVGRIMAAIKMVLDAAGDTEEISDKDICEAIDWCELESLEREYDRLKGGKA